MKNVAIIPARGGSKRLPGKNIRNFLEKPVISYSIKAAIESELFEEVMVSTDDEKVAAIAKQYGAEVPFMRSALNANDFATTSDVLQEVFLAYLNEGKQFRYACCIYPCAPFVTPKKLREAYQLLLNNEFDSVFPIAPFASPIQRALRLNEGKTEMFEPANINKRTQDLEKAYYDAGQFYFFKIDRFLRNLKLWTDNSGAIVMSPMEVQDIDHEEDWKLAEIKYKLLLNK